MFRWITTVMEVVVPILMMSPWERWAGELGRRAVSLRTVPLEVSRSEMDQWEPSDWMRRWFWEIAGSLMVKVLPRMTRPILTVEPWEQSRVSPLRGPFSMMSFRLGFFGPSSSIEEREREMEILKCVLWFFRGK